MYGWFQINDSGQPNAPSGGQAPQLQQNPHAQMPPQQLASALSSNLLPTIDESMRIGMSIPGIHTRNQLPSLSNPFMDALHVPPQGLQRVFPRPSSILPSSFSSPVGFDRVGARAAALPVSGPQNPLQPMYPLHNGAWPPSTANVALALGAQPPPMILPALALTLHGQHPLHAAPDRAADDGQSGPADDPSEDDSAEARAAGPNAARRSRGRPRGAKDKQPRVKRAPAPAVPPHGEDGCDAEGRDDGRGRAPDPDDPPSPRSERRPARRNRPDDPAAARGEGSDGPAAGGAGGEGCGRRKPWKIVLTAQDAIDIYRERTSGRQTASLSAELADRYAVNAKTIRDIWNRETWVKTTRPLWTEPELRLFEDRGRARRRPLPTADPLREPSPPADGPGLPLPPPAAAASAGRGDVRPPSAASSPELGPAAAGRAHSGEGGVGPGSRVKNKRGRPPGSKDSRPRRRKMAEGAWDTTDDLPAPAPAAPGGDGQRRGASPDSSESDSERARGGGGDARGGGGGRRPEPGEASRRHLDMLATISSMDPRPPPLSPPAPLPAPSAEPQHHRPWSPVETLPAHAAAAAAAGGDDGREGAGRPDGRGRELAAELSAAVARERERDWGAWAGALPAGWRPGAALLVDGGPPPVPPRSPWGGGSGPPGLRGGGELPPEAGGSGAARRQ